MGRTKYVLSPFPFGRSDNVLPCSVFLEKHLPFLAEDFISRKPSLFSVWELWVCMKRHCKTGLPQPNVIWHTWFSEAAVLRPRQEWRNTEGSYETRVSEVFPFVPSSAVLIFASMWNGCVAQLGPSIRWPQEGNVLLAFSTMYDSRSRWADHSWKLSAHLQVTDPFALMSSCKDSRGLTQGTQDTLCQIPEIKKRC